MPRDRTPRFVNNDRRINVSGSYSQQYFDDPATWSHYGGVMNVPSSVTTGSSDPDWRLAIASGRSATTEMVGVHRTLGFSPVFYSHQTKPGYPNYAVQVRGAPFNMTFLGIDSLSDSLAASIAASNFLKSYIKEQVHFRGGNVIAEFAETVRMLASPLKSMYKHTWKYVGKVRSLRRTFQRDPVLYGKLLTGSWLAYSFGVKPLLSDIKEAHAAVKNLSENLGSADTVRIIGTGDNVISSFPEPNSVVPTGFAQQLMKATATYSVRYTGAVRCQPPGVAAIITDFGVGFYDLAPAVWEAVPWSFLVDYFTNVGEMLDSLRLASANLAWLQKTTRNTHRNVGYPMYSTATASDLARFSIEMRGGTWWTQVKRVHRLAETVMPYPSWDFKIPGLGSNKWLNVGALAHQISLSNPRR